MRPHKPIPAPPITFEPLAGAPKKIGRPPKPLKEKYPPKLTIKRNAYRNAVMSGLREITGLADPDMTWAPERRSGEPVTIFRFGVEVHGVPFADFESPGAISSCRRLDDLIEGFASGRIRWVRLSRAEIRRRKRMHGIEGIPNWVLASRADASLLRPVRPVETSQWLRKGSVNKTSESVPEEILEAERIEELEARMARELAAEAEEDLEDEIEEAVWTDEA